MTIIKAILLPTMVLLCFALQALAQEPAPFVTGKIYQGKVVEVVDGNTITILSDTEELRIRLAGISVHPNEQATHSSRSNLSRLVKDKTVEVSVIGQESSKDSESLPLGRVKLGEVDIALRQLRDGFASTLAASSNYLSQAEQELYAEAAREAKAARRGLWDDSFLCPQDRTSTDKASSIITVKIIVDETGKVIFSSSYMWAANSARVGCQCRQEGEIYTHDDRGNAGQS